jgi:hypothetical protein
MAVTNFLQWNPTASNQENDTAWNADAQRVAGFQLDNTVPSIMLNKAFYQWSTFITAFCNMMVNKGYSPNDASLSALTAVLSNILTNADTQSSIVNVPYSPSIVFNRAQGLAFQVLLTGNITASSLTNLTPGARLLFVYQQDGTGGRSVVWPSQIVATGQGGVIDNTAPANAIFMQEFLVLDDGASVRAIGPMTQG